MRPQHPVVRGYIYRTRPGTWQYQVWAVNRLIATDNTGDWKTVYDTCRRITAAASLLLRHDLTIRPTPECRAWLKAIPFRGQS